MARIRSKTPATVSAEQATELILAGLIEFDEWSRLKVLVGEGRPLEKALRIIEQERGVDNGTETTDRAGSGRRTVRRRAGRGAGAAQ
jgi:hypothetical protein